MTINTSSLTAGVIDIYATEGINVENLCYEMFLDFSKGKEIIVPPKPPV